MRVVVTGAAGHIGREVTAELVARGHEVVPVDRSVPDDSGEGEIAPWHVGDVRDAAFMSALMVRTRPDALAHLAAIPRPTLGASHEVFATNTQATFVALETAGDAGVRRIVIASSTSALGTVFPVAAAGPVSPLYAPVDEDHPFLGSDPYALSKQVDEATAATMQRRHGYQVVALRIPNTGPMDAQVARAASVAADPSILANELWAYLDIRDAARAFALALECDMSGCPVINVMAPDTNAAEPTVDLLARFHPTTRLRRPLADRDVPFDLTRARELLGFEAEHLLPGSRG